MAEIPAKRGNWKKTGAKKSVKYQYKTIDEVIAEGGPIRQRFGGDGSGVKVWLFPLYEKFLNGLSISSF